LKRGPRAVVPSTIAQTKIPYQFPSFIFFSHIFRGYPFRRNLSNFARVELALKLKDVIKERAKKNMLSTQNNEKASAYQLVGKQVEPINTNKELGKIAGV